MARKEAHKEAGADDPRRPATRVRASRLLSAVKDVIGAVATKDTIPILSHVVIAAHDGLIDLTATDLDMQAERRCASDDRYGPGSAEWIASIAPFALAVPGKALVAVLSGFDPDAMVTLAVEGSRLSIAAGRSRFRLSALAAADMPMLTRFDLGHEFEIGAGVLAEAIDGVVHAISTEEARYYLNGIYVHPVDLVLRFVTTDGKRLAMVGVDAPDGAHAWPPMIVPRGIVGELAKALAHAMKIEGAPMVVVRCDDAARLVSFELPAADDGELTLTGKVIDGTFPDYLRVIPISAPREATIGREALAEAVARVAALANKESRLIRLDIGDDRIDLTAQHASLGDAREEVPAVHDGDDQAIGFDAKFLRDALGAFGADDVVMRWTDGAAPVRFEASGSNAQGVLPARLQVVMPVRVPG